MTLGKGISLVGGLTLVSRLFGFVRDLLMARYLGAGMAADAFFIAFKLPNFFRRLFAEGAFSVAFIPMFSRILGKDITEESQANARVFAEKVLAVFLPILLLLLLIMELAMVPVMFGLTGGFEGNQEKFNLAVELGRYTFPYLVLVSLVTLWAGMLNAFGRFAAAAFAPVLLNISMIAAMLMAPETDVIVARYLAVGISVAGVLQLVLLMYAAKKNNLSLRLRLPRLSPDVKQLLILIGPAAVGAGAMQLNLLIDVFLAARYLPEGSVSWLFYADRLNQLPIGVIGVAVGTVLLPDIARRLGSGDETGALHQQNQALVFSMMLTIPAALALATIAQPLIASLFEREAFSSADSFQTSAALVAYALGLPAYVLTKVLAPGFYARGDTKTPVKFGIITLVVNTSANLLLIGPFGHVGLALGTAIAAWVNVLLLYGSLHLRGHFSLIKGVRLKLVKFLLSAVVMAYGLMVASAYLRPFFAEDTLGRVGALAALIVGGGLLYFIVLLLIRGIGLSEFRAIFSRKA
ncbi:murein biosynthesis integral membrane protein MurJ [Temperatibacter marinus]|uniref:Probable lipid II flippase MurJ n=1 Tax=Temperatibacter marinus TaxID=1456591 RepID=A0AA52HA96_9PROT|nr:murein biosynthesis integral membrane protein MurJ [Temperatibacter marinus]WND03744.1 murein biosynthesis integral membrane protein MurJ [Temperatibacter marinus]